MRRSGQERKERRRQRLREASEAQAGTANVVDSPNNVPVDPVPAQPDNVTVDEVAAELVDAKPRDLRPLERAVKQRWPIGNEARQQAVQELTTIMGSATDYRTRIAAVRGLTAMDRINQIDELAARGRDGDGNPFAPPAVAVQVNATDGAKVQFYLPDNQRDPEP